MDKKTEKRVLAALHEICCKKYSRPIAPVLYSAMLEHGVGGGLISPNQIPLAGLLTIGYLMHKKEYKLGKKVKTPLMQRLEEVAKGGAELQSERLDWVSVKKLAGLIYVKNPRPSWVRRRELALYNRLEKLGFNLEKIVVNPATPRKPKTIADLEARKQYVKEYNRQYYLRVGKEARMQKIIK